MDKWTPKTEGAGFELTPTLEPLARFRDQLLVLSGLAHKEAMPIEEDRHVRPLTRLCHVSDGSSPESTRQAKISASGISMDQIAAEKLGKDTQLASLEVGLFLSELVGTCEPG